jgi:hypothetical protein
MRDKLIGCEVNDRLVLAIIVMGVIASFVCGCILFSNILEAM